MVHSIFFSPHLDDAIYSCGGLISRLTRAGESVTVATLFAGDPQPGPLSEFARELHARWGLQGRSVEMRRQEDLVACSLVGAGAIHIELPEAIYRRDVAGHVLYPDEAAIFSEPASHDQALIADLQQVMAELSSDGSRPYLPLAVGAHVDHVLLRRAAVAWTSRFWSYHDLPYAARGVERSGNAERGAGPGMVQPIDEEDLERWARATWAYRSQRSTFWTSETQLREELGAYLDAYGGVPLLAPAAIPD